MFSFIKNFINLQIGSLLSIGGRGVPERLYPHANFEMSYPYFPEWSTPQQTTNGYVRYYPIHGSVGILDSKFLDKSGVTIGRCSQFNQDVIDKSARKATYYFEGTNERERFFDTVVNGKGVLRAKVKTSDGSEVVYRCEARTSEWREVNRVVAKDRFECVVQK